jgi:hypothetical protein
MAKRKRKSTRRRSRRRASRRRSPVTALRRHSVYLTNRKRHRVRHRRNPPLVGGLVKDTVQGLKDGAAVLIGKASTRVVSSYIPIGTNTGVVGAVKQVVVAVGVGFAAKKLVKRGDFARFVTAGGIAAALESIVKGLNIPILSANLGGGEEFGAMSTTGGSAYEGIAPGVAAYPGGPALSAYPMGDLGDGMGELGMMGAM